MEDYGLEARARDSLYRFFSKSAVIVSLDLRLTKGLSVFCFLTTASLLGKSLFNGYMIYYFFGSSLSLLSIFSQAWIGILNAALRPPFLTCTI